MEEAVAPKVLAALDLASQALTRAQVRHLVVGGLAVAANGYPRATLDVDFLVGPEAFDVHEGGLVTLRVGVPFQVNGVAIDLLSAQADEPFLEAELAAPPGSIAGAPLLVYLKLKSPRHKDRTDVIELVKAGVDVDACRAYLEAHAPAMVALFDETVARAEAEQE
jgi:hypothetical protein